MAISEPVTRIFPGRNASLASIGEWIRAQARSCGLAQTAVDQVEMAVDEACSNIIEHAYRAEDRGQIECTCQALADGLRITLKDTGQPFQPKNIRKPNLKASLNDREGHGLGLVFIREWMDEVEYGAEPGGVNVLTLFKKRAGGQSPDHPQE